MTKCTNARTVAILGANGNGCTARKQIIVALFIKLLVMEPHKPGTIAAILVMVPTTQILPAPNLMTMGTATGYLSDLK